ncbi:hypothetical protein [Thermococcus sp. Bubb.Bath]|uniref:hypothetical protein n=1 Tax=Thermococcus sp. Bubb.Bath TaxID=1638242 RepID=UPI0014397B6F|nr:hypothetical protein [Thermococcus sp. Bubb.Bath]NJF25223.1 hypothetical protein [Thermococcus sp. Bubb.Bath]
MKGRWITAVLAAFLVISTGFATASNESWTIYDAHITKDEAESLGLKLIGGGGGGNGNWENTYQWFRCPGYDDEHPQEITLMLTHYDNDEAVKLFEGVKKAYLNLTDHDTEMTSIWDGSVYGVEHHYYKLVSGDGYVGYKEVMVRDFYDGRETETYLKYRYAALVNYHYYVSLEAEVQKGYADCNLDSALLALVNTMLSKIPNNTVRFPSTLPAGTPTGGTGGSTGSSGGSLSPQARERMETTNEKLRNRGLSWGGVITVKTPGGTLIKFKNEGYGYTGKSSALSWKFKYYGNKALDSFIDKASSYLPKPIGIFKDWFKADKDVNVFSDDEAVRKTAQDLHVDGKSAFLYNRMSGIEKRELEVSKVSNAVDVPPLAKPIEVVFKSMGVAIKKTQAENYEWEYRKTAEIALRYKKAGLKYRDIIRETVNEMEDTTQGMNRVNMLNRYSGGDYRDQEARVRLYINELFQEGKI